MPHMVMPCHVMPCCFHACLPYHCQPAKAQHMHGMEACLKRLLLERQECVHPPPILEREELRRRETPEQRVPSMDEVFAFAIVIHGRLKETAGIQAVAIAFPSPAPAPCLPSSRYRELGFLPLGIPPFPSACSSQREESSSREVAGTGASLGGTVWWHSPLSFHI